MKAFCIVLAAGQGRRVGADKNKLLLPLGTEPVLQRTLRAVDRAGCFCGGIIVCRDDERECIQAIPKRTEYLYVTGGKTRQESAGAALEHLPDDVDIVAIHDGARCFATPELFRECVSSAIRCGSGVAGRYCVDTIKRVKEDLILETLDRSELVQIETPQVFPKDLILEAYRRAEMDGFVGTDDSQLVERMGKKPVLVDIGVYNPKVTTMDDLERAEQMIGSALNLRIGHGQDTHALVCGRALILGGVNIPSEVGLLGHSDADVLVHAIMDALLGAAAMGDIGARYPDTDERYRGADSLKLLKDVADSLRDEGHSIINVDTVISLQRPKIAPYVQDMRRNISNALNISINCVGVKATTTEKLGFIGRSEGASANASALIRI